MTTRATFRKADVKRLIEGATAAGLRFEVVYDGDQVVLRPVDGPKMEDEGAALRRRMDEAFAR